MSDDSDIQNKAATSSESSDNARPLVSNKRHRKQLILSSEDDSSEEEIIAVNWRPPDGSFSESSSDADCQSERCPICLTKFKAQEVGSLETCDHCFCLACIQEWAKNASTCPVDRQPFSLILVRQHLEGKVVRHIPISTRSDTPVSEEAVILMSCEFCEYSDWNDRLLVCYSCDRGYHMNCLNPPLEHEPIDEWYCPECAPIFEVARLTRQPRPNIENASEEEESIVTYRPALSHAASHPAV